MQEVEHSKQNVLFVSASKRRREINKRRSKLEMALSLLIEIVHINIIKNELQTTNKLSNRPIQVQRFLTRKNLELKLSQLLTHQCHIVMNHLLQKLTISFTYLVEVEVEVEFIQLKDSFIQLKLLQQVTNVKKYQNVRQQY